MKYIFYLLISLVVISDPAKAQNVTINTDGSSADASALLDVKSTTQGILLPRMSTTQVNALSLPGTGLFVYNTTINAFQVNTGTSVSPIWTTLGAANSQTILFSPTGDVTGSATGTTTLAPALTIGAGKVVNSMIANSTIDLTTKVSGILPIVNGGTNSNAALNNNRVMKSSGGKIIEAAAITANRAVISDANGIPTHSSVTDTELGYVSGATSNIQAQLNSRQSTILTNTHILVGNGSNLATDVAAGGDVTLANTGTFTIANNAITTVKIADGNVSNAKLANSTISGVALGSNLNTLSLGYGLTGTSYNGSAAVLTKVDTSTSSTNPATQGFVLRNQGLIGHIVGNSGPIGFTAGTGAGTSPTITVTGNDIGGKISVITGSSPMANAPIITINFVSPYPTPVYVTFGPGNANSANLTSGIGKQVYISSTSVSNFVLGAPTTALGGSGIQYIWYYMVSN